MADPRARVILEAIRSGNAAFAGFQSDLDAIATRAKIIGAAAAAAITLVVKNSFQAVDALKDEADALGIATDKLAGLQLAAKLNNVDAEQLNRSLIKQTQIIYDAARGQKSAVEALGQLGMKYTDLINLSPDQQFVRIADALGKVENSTERVGIATDIFGTKNAALINMLAMGRDGLEAAQEQAVRFGTALSRIDTEKVGAAMDAIDLVKEKIKGFGNLIAVELSPFIVALSNEIIGVGGDADDMKEKIRAALNVIGTGVGMVLDAFYGWRLIILKLREGMLAFAAFNIEVMAKIVRAAEDARAAVGRIWLDAIKISEALDPLGIGQLVGRDFIKGVAEGMVSGGTGISDWMSGVAESFRATSAHAAQLAQELIAAGLPSAALAEKVGQIRAEAQAAAEAAARLVRPTGQEATVTTGGVDDAAAKRREDIAKELEELRQSWLTKEQIEVEAHARRQSMLEAAREQGLIDEQRYWDLSSELAAQHFAKITRMHKDALKEQSDARKAEVMTMLNNMAGVFGALAALTAANADRSKKSFELNKKIGIANAIVSTAVGVAKALEGPFPWNLINAAIVLAAGLKQVQAIRSTSWNGGGAAGSVGGGGGGGAGATSESPIQGQIEAARDRGRASLVVNVTVQGSVLGEGGRTALAEDLTKLLRDHVERTDDTLVTVRSRNAQDIAATG